MPCGVGLETVCEVQAAAAEFSQFANWHKEQAAMYAGRKKEEAATPML
ncbi:hypothetical protein [Microcoleus sp. EPA2]